MNPNQLIENEFYWYPKDRFFVSYEMKSVSDDDKPPYEKWILRIHGTSKEFLACGTWIKYLVEVDPIMQEYLNLFDKGNI